MPKEPEEIDIYKLSWTSEEIDRESYAFFNRPYGQIPHWFAQSFGMFAYRLNSNFEDMFGPVNPGKCQLLSLVQRKINRDHKARRRYPPSYYANPQLC